MTASVVSSSPTTPRLRSLRDVAYVAGSAADARQRLDLYLPVDAPGRFPVVVAVPGGGLLEGDKANDEFVGRRLAGAGFATAVINYRLSPAVAHPGHVEDVAAAVAWVLRHIGELGGDPSGVFVVGHSAGAYLTALLATDVRYLVQQGVAIEQLRGIVPVSGFYWVERIASNRPKHIWGESEAAWHAASPARHLHARLPPALFVHADGDDADRRLQNADIARAAREAGNAQVESIEIAGRDHRSLWTRIAEPNDELGQRLISFLRSIVGGSRQSLPNAGTQRTELSLPSSLP
jgi:acetyl esterase/lipase